MVAELARAARDDFGDAYPAPAAEIAASGSGARRFLFSVESYHALEVTAVFHPHERTELIEGEIYILTPIDSRHAAGTKRILHVFGELKAKAALINVQNPLTLPGSRSEPVPDAMLVKPRPDFYEDAFPTPADVMLLMEVSDATLAFDRHVKLPLYAHHGIRESWVLNPVENVLEIYTEPRNGKYTLRRIAERGETVSPQAFPKFRVRVADLFGKVAPARA